MVDRELPSSVVRPRLDLLKRVPVGVHLRLRWEEVRSLFSGPGSHPWDDFVDFVRGRGFDVCPGWDSGVPPNESPATLRPDWVEIWRVE